MRYFESPVRNLQDEQMLVEQRIFITADIFTAHSEAAQWH